MSKIIYKGEHIDLQNPANDFDLSKVVIGLGWDMRQKGFWSSLMGHRAPEYDLDAIAFVLNKDGKVVNIGRSAKFETATEGSLMGSDVVFFGNLRHHSGHILLTKDSRDGGGKGDDECIELFLNQLSSEYQRVLFLVTIYQGRRREQHFGMLKNAFIRATDAKGKEIFRFNISNNPDLEHKRALIFGGLERTAQNTWIFEAVGEGLEADHFIEVLQSYK
jgi:tellurium resistance protein TerD